MDAIKQQYKTNITWSFFETIFFQSLLFIHQYILFKTTEPHFYGLVGTLFGCIYFCVKFCDFGFNKIITAFFLDYSIDQKTIYFFLKNQILPSFIFYIALIIFILYAKTVFIPLSVHTNILCILIAIIGIETIKMNVKKILQLSHHFRHIALFEISFMIGYQSSIWSYYYFQQSLSLSIIFGSFLIISMIETSGLFFCAYKWYLQLPLSSVAQSNNLNSLIIIKNRLCSYSHSMGKQLFSANILVPLFAYFFGLESAAFLKLASYMIHGISIIIEKIIDPSSAVLFAHTKNESLQNKQEYFSFASYILYNILLCIFIFICINYGKIIHLNFAHKTTLMYIFIYFLIHYCEHFFIVIEKFYIAHHRSEFLIINTLFNGFLALLIFFYTVSPLIALIYLLVSRIISLYISFFILSSLWKIKHRVTIKPLYFISTLIISLLFFILF